MFSNIKYFYFLIITFLFLFFPQTSLASFTFQIDSISKTQVINNEEEIISTITITDLPSGDSYFRVAIQKNAGDTYFGYTRNNENGWVQINTSQDCKNYFKVIGPGSSTISLGTKIGDTNFSENGQYNLKARRYTSSCSTTYDSNSMTFDILVPTPSPTQPPATQQQTAQPTQVPTANPTVKPTPTKSPTSKPTATPTEEAEETDKPEENKITNLFTEIVEATPTGLVAGVSTKNKSSTVAITFVSLGILFLGYGGYLLYNNKLKDNENGSTDERQN